MCRGRFAGVEDLHVCCKFFEIHDIYPSFQTKLDKCCHEVMVNNFGDCVMAPKKEVISEKQKEKFSIFLAVTCYVTHHQNE